MQISIVFYPMKSFRILSDTWLDFRILSLTTVRSTYFLYSTYLFLTIKELYTLIYGLLQVFKD